MTRFGTTNTTTVLIVAAAVGFVALLVALASPVEADRCARLYRHAHTAADTLYVATTGRCDYYLR